MELDNIFLEELTLAGYKNEIDLQVFEKILRYKNLKIVNFYTNLSDEQIGKINGKNNSITSLYVTKDKVSGQMLNLINKFPNLNLLSLSSGGFENKDIELIENSNCKIKSINLSNLSNVKAYCQSYDSLTSFSIVLMKISNYNNIFPFNIINKKITFNSLTNFVVQCFNSENIDTDFLNKLYSVLDSMPNLNFVSLNIFSNYITEDYYKKLLKKILSKDKLNCLVYSVLTKNSNSAVLTKDVVQHMFPDIKIGNILSFFVRKYI